MKTLERQVLAERVSAVERHLERVRTMLPPSAEGFLPNTNASDAVILHLWQAVQIVIDLAVSLCVRLNLGSPSSYRDAFERLQRAAHLEAELAERLARAAGFRNMVAHAYEALDMRRVHAAASEGPADIRNFLLVARDLTQA
jgi:uncharacterized protein YutE (UPF0331/DUF86 family)